MKHSPCSQFLRTRPAKLRSAALGTPQCRSAGRRQHTHSQTAQCSGARGTSSLPHQHPALRLRGLRGPPRAPAAPRPTLGFPASPGEIPARLLRDRLRSRVAAAAHRGPGTARSPPPGWLGTPRHRCRGAAHGSRLRPRWFYTHPRSPGFAKFQPHFTPEPRLPFLQCPTPHRRTGTLSSPLTSGPARRRSRPPAVRALPGPGSACGPSRAQLGPAAAVRGAAALRTPPELQLVQVLEQAAGAVCHGGRAVEAASELPAGLLLLLRRPLAGLGANPGLGHSTRPLPPADPRRGRSLPASRRRRRRPNAGTSLMAKEGPRLASPPAPAATPPPRRASAPRAPPHAGRAGPGPGPRCCRRRLAAERSGAGPSSSGTAAGTAGGGGTRQHSCATQGGARSRTGACRPQPGVTLRPQHRGAGAARAAVPGRRGDQSSMTQQARAAHRGVRRLSRFKEGLQGSVADRLPMS